MRPRLIVRAALAYALLTGGVAAARAEEPAITVTTDSAGFCATLDRLLAVGGGERGDEVLRLTREGDEMCAEGEVRGGIARLRRALVLWEEGQGHGRGVTAGFGGGAAGLGVSVGRGPPASH